MISGLVKPETLIKIEKDAETRLKKEERRVLNEKTRYFKIQHRADTDVNKLYRAENRLLKAQNRLNKAKRAYDIHEFEKLQRLTGLRLSYAEIKVFANLTALFTFISSIMVLYFSLFLFQINLRNILSFTLPFLSLLPVLVHSYIFSYPERLAKRRQIEMIGNAPEALNYLTMSMSIKPSLNQAVLFAAENTGEPIASGLKKLAWDVYTNNEISIEDSLLSYAREIEGWNEDIKTSLFLVRSATLEKTREGLLRVLDKANDNILFGTRSAVARFTNTLSTPTTIFFALGIVMPLIVGALMPVFSLSFPSASSMSQSTTFIESSASNQSHSDFTTIFLMTIVFPLVAFSYAHRVLAKRPGTKMLPEIKKLPSALIQRAVLTSSILFVSISLSPLVLRDFLPVNSHLFIIIAAGLSISFYCFTTTRRQKILRDRIIKTEEELPDTLFQLGSAISEGQPFEKAIVSVAGSTKRTVTADLLQKMTFNFKINKEPTGESLFGRDGVLTDHPSSMVKASFKAAVELTEKDAEVAGQSIIRISQHLRDMEKLNKEIKMKLAPIVDMMKTTGMIFAPLIMGITVAIYTLLSKEFAQLPDAAPLMSPELFSLVIGVYLVLMVLIISYFSTGIEANGDRIELKHHVSRVLPVACLVYVGTTIVATSVMV